MLLILLITANLIGGGLAKSLSVTDFGAKGDGTTDDTPAFLLAWDAACTQSTEPSILLVPKWRSFLLNHVVFQGPCKHYIRFQVDGNILRPDQIWQAGKGSYGHWITFIHITDLSIVGSGEVDGRGAAWWSCKRNHRCPLMASNALAVLDSDKILVAGLRIVSSPMMHVVVGFSTRVWIDNVRISSPPDSPNTDGIHIEGTRHVSITNSIIGTGDDCVSIGKGTYDVNVSGITCGPGHGISIGSLGGQNSLATVEEIQVKHCNISNTTNGLRIKTWQGGSGYAKNILFKDINLNAVENPIVIDQYYRNGRSQRQGEKTSAVRISEVKYIGVVGTTKSRLAINLNCSKNVPCTGIEMDNIDIQPVAPGREVEAACRNAHGTKKNKVFPTVLCLT